MNNSFPLTWSRALAQFKTTYPLSGGDGLSIQNPIIIPVHDDRYCSTIERALIDEAETGSPWLIQIKTQSLINHPDNPQRELDWLILELTNIHTLETMEVEVYFDVTGFLEGYQNL